MPVHLERRWGGGGTNPSEQELREALAELDVPDEEHPDAWLTDDEGRTLSVFEAGRVVHEDPESSDGPRYLANVSREEALRLWLAFAGGKAELLENMPWKAGYGPPRSEADQAADRAKAAAAQLNAAREFYDSLGEERADARCRIEGCARGAVRFSAFCRPHHFASLRGACPFDD